MGFILALRASGRTAKTESTYRESLNTLHRFSEETGMPSPEHMTAEHLREFLLSLYERGNRPGTVSVRYRALQAFYEWLVDEGERQDNPLSRIPPPRVEQRILPHYTPEDMGRLLVVTQGRNRQLLDVRDTAIILTLFDTGLRGQELCGLTRDGLDLNALSLRVPGKGQKERIVGLGYKAAKAIDRYLRRRVDDAPWVFVGRSARQLSFNALRLMLVRRFQQAGLTFRGVHAFRRGFAMAYLESGGRLRTCAFSPAGTARRC